MTDQPTRQPDLLLRLRRPTEPDGLADRRLRSFLKRTLRGHGYRCTEIVVVREADKHNTVDTSNPTENPHAQTRHKT